MKKEDKVCVLFGFILLLACVGLGEVITNIVMLVKIIWR